MVYVTQVKTEAIHRKNDLSNLTDNLAVFYEYSVRKIYRIHTKDRIKFEIPFFSV